MQSYKNVFLELQNDQIAPIVYAKQNDRDTRGIVATLYNGGLPFVPDVGTLAVFRYKKPDGTEGYYDTLEDNTTPAVTISGSTVTVIFAEHVLTAAGNVFAEINLYNAGGQKLTTFSLMIVVQASVLSDATIVSSSYYNVLTAQIAAALAAEKKAAASATAAAESAKKAAESAAQASGAKSVDGVKAGTDGNVNLSAVRYAAQTLTAAQQTQARDNIGAGVHANLLDNWDFRAGSVVNQRATSGAVGAGGIVADRWKVTSGTATLTDAGIALNGTMVQIRETALGLPFKASGIMESGAGTFAYDDADKVFAVTSAGGTVSRVKLELGGASTLAADPPADYLEELRKCKRFLRIIRQLPLCGIVTEAKNAFLAGYDASEMRIVPTVVANTAGFSFSPGSLPNIYYGSSFTVTSLAMDGMRMVCYLSGYTLPSGVGVIIFDNPIYLTAEL